MRHLNDLLARFLAQGSTIDKFAAQLVDISIFRGLAVQCDSVQLDSIVFIVLVLLVMVKLLAVFYVLYVFHIFVLFCRFCILPLSENICR